MDNQDQLNIQGLESLITKFRSEAKCRRMLEGLRWPNGIRCPRCDKATIGCISTRNQFECGQCFYHFSVTSGTMFHGSNLPLHKWFASVYLLIQSRNRASANLLARALNISYKTAWYVCHRIRAAIEEPDADPAVLEGIVDLTKFWDRPWRKSYYDYGPWEKAALLMLRRGNLLTFKIVHALYSENLDDCIQNYVVSESKEVLTTASVKKRHQSSHSSKEESAGPLHDRLDEFYVDLANILKQRRTTWTVDHVDAYLAELEWRFNNRDNSWLFRDTLLRMLRTDTLPFTQLVSKDKRR